MDGDDEDKGGFDRGEFNPSGQPIDVDDEDEEAKGGFDGREFNRLTRRTMGTI